MRACGILFCFNEEQIIADTIEYYLSCGIDLVVFDNQSTDATPAIIQSFRSQPGRYPGSLRDVITIVTDGYEWTRILHSACDYMHANLSSYDWILIIDADALYASAVRGLTILDFMAEAQKSGYNILNGVLYEFYPTEKDDPAVSSPFKRLRYYKTVDEGFHATMFYHKIFRYHPSVDFYTFGGHVCKRDHPRVFKSVGFLYKHYPWVSFEHGLKKIFRDRKPRYVERRKHVTWHWQWLGMLPVREDLVKDSRNLRFFEEKDVCISQGYFRWILRFAPLRWARWAGIFIRRLRRTCELGRCFAPAFSFGSIRHMIGLLARELRKVVMVDLRHASGPAVDGKKELWSVKLKSLLMAYRSLLRQDAVSFGFPKTYHFLMTNYCNARCVFCNQPQDPGGRRELTLAGFKVMLENIPVETARNFSFSGGGDPLLCPDLLSIIRHTNEKYPWVDVHLRTNGFLLKQYVSQLASLRIASLEISVHGRPAVNDAITQRQGSEMIFEGISLLNAELARRKKKVRISLYPCVSRANISDIPWLLRKARELGIHGVSVNFLRYFHASTDVASGALNTSDSLFFHQELYNTTIRSSKKLARFSGVDFEYEPLFSGRHKNSSCLLPWLVVVVDSDGTVYPCTGGEVWFREQVASGKYHFGNLLHEHLYQFWNNDSYVMIRRTCSPHCRNHFVPECDACHNTLCFKGPDTLTSHILAPRA